VKSARPRFVLIATLAIAASGCARSAPQNVDANTGDAVRIPVTIDTEKGPLVIQAEVADDEDERRRGLMFRATMGADQGMLFLFPTEEQLSFWMRNTLIPLDMIFIRSDKTILGVVENAEPKTETPRRVAGTSQFVLEVNGGVAAAQGIKAGQTVSFYAPTPAK
jgi:uncharacterized protein